ncbi:hydroxypyruvate isomerase family protein [Methylobacterium gnaphalii]|uniref:Hydroxypyruvate isomerase n=1 Tax=Methylobacterium gnaphalii TaxID=1010610 RepID=A0A512JJT2_9HYPH|nr:TIM barrel protein [Methylobacterium gnaphalii]GEP10217.1 hydroxypyruvate isomerase [Methylobacterium gnaphalii]GJD68573.1 2-oxo-tetronate isomerase [Methylobacterium gnaphalii]GLS48734.1 hydroxypyruvate isomerase [Methylobacterium gnaphalii]
MPIDLGPFAGRLSAHLGFLYTEHPLPERFAAAAENGFRIVEHPNLFAHAANEIAGWLAASGLTLVQTSFPAGETARGEKGFAALPDRAGIFRESVEPTLDFVEAIGGCRLVHAMAGVSPVGVQQDRLLDIYRESLAYAADAAARRNIEIMIEPIGPGSIADYIVDDPLLAIRLIREVGRPNIKLLFDAYHCHCLGHDPASLIREHAPLIAHVQIADDPGRHEPGTGTIRFEPIFEALAEAGYEGAIGCEYHPADTTEEGLGWIRGAA